FHDAPAVCRAKGREMRCIPVLTHGVIHIAPLRGFLVENGEWRVENGDKRTGASQICKSVNP
ncbi:MAG: hypothetical protein LBG31_01235, partial [Prevotellaceae bacterium]|nr:hypothetical protein [Prevotellaceae bacterium]